MKANFSSDTWEAKTPYNAIFKVLKKIKPEFYMQPNMLKKCSIKTFQMNKNREYIAKIPALKEC